LLDSVHVEHAGIELPFERVVVRQLHARDGPVADTHILSAAHALVRPARHLVQDDRKRDVGVPESKVAKRPAGLHRVHPTREHDREQVFRAWRAFQHEHHDRERLNTEIAPIQTELRQLLEDASPKSRRTRWHRRFANNLLKVWPALWAFTTISGVEPTNNSAERALRGPVIHQKVSLGTQSEDGERFAERALSAAATCRLQRRSLFTYLSELITAHTRGDPFPALT
jgi:hypothetical protein